MDVILHTIKSLTAFVRILIMLYLLRELKIHAMNSVACHYII